MSWETSCRELSCLGCIPGTYMGLSRLPVPGWDTRVAASLMAAGSTQIVSDNFVLSLVCVQRERGLSAKHIEPAPEEESFYILPTYLNSYLYLYLYNVCAFINVYCWRMSLPCVQQSPSQGIWVHCPDLRGHPCCAIPGCPR